LKTLNVKCVNFDNRHSVLYEANEGYVFDATLSPILGRRLSWKKIDDYTYEVTNSLKERR